MKQSIMNKSHGTYIRSQVFIFSVFMLVCLSATAQNMDYALQDVKTSEPFHDGLAVFMGDNCLYGAINTSGQVAIQPQFKYLSEFANGTAVAKTETGEGIINRNGIFILEPKYQIHREISRPDIYSIKDGNKYGLFYNGRMVLPLIYKHKLDAYNFPFVRVALQNGKTETINILTGELFDSYFKQGNIVTCKKDSFLYYYTEKGESLDKNMYKQSSNGVLLYKNEYTKKYGLKNADGRIIIDAKYSLTVDDIWIDDRMILFDPIKGETVVINNLGEIILYNNKANYSSYGKYIVEQDYVNSSVLFYDSSGKRLLTIHGISAVNIGHKEWFMINLDNQKKIIYDVQHKKLFQGVDYATYEKDVISIYKVDGSLFFYDANTGKQIAGPIKSSSYGFHDGLAVVQRIGTEYNEVIDKHGKVILKSRDNLTFGHYFSEGVISVEEKNIHNYIYNPLGHKDYVYNQSNYSDRTIAQWNKLGHLAFSKKQYATAKDYYYRVMMNDPTDVNSVINYGAALGNLGYYDEAIESCRIALDSDPDNQLAKDNLRINLDNKRREEERQQQAEEAKREERSTKSSTFWDALGNFANILSSVAGGTSVYQPYSSFSMDADYSPSYSNSGGSNHDYQSEYNRWANLAEGHYNSLTNLGYRVKHKDGSRSGGTLSSMSGSKYVQMKKSLRDAQHEMQRIRRKAAQNGVTITPSTWETATVGY